MNETIEVVEEPEKNRGGAAPPHRQCRRILDGGQRCRDWEIRGQGLCFKHGRWEGTRRKGPITVPLMEDYASILLVASQTVRAMALGTIPPSNGRVILMGCREARSLLRDQLAEKRLAVQMKRWDVELDDPEPEPVEVVEASGEWLAPVYDEREIIRKVEAERAAEHAARDKARAAAAAAAGVGTEDPAEKPADSAPVAASGAAEKAPESLATESVPEGLASGIVSGSAAQSWPDISYAEWARIRGGHPPAERADADDPPEPDALWVPDSTARFRDLKKKWDYGLKQAEVQTTDMYFKRYGETREEYKEALQRPYEAYFEEGRE